MDLGGTQRSKQGIERIFFIVDRSRLKEESDELKNAIVVYIPENDLKKHSLEQRCSQLVGISLLILHFMNKLPKYVRLKSHGYAIKSLGDSTYIMGLQSKFDEPQLSVIQYLERIHDFFMFYYSSPHQVMKTSFHDWEIFTAQMSAIFQCILDFTFRDTHSLPSMFNPLPYISLDSEQGGTRLFLQAHRLLRNVQLNKNVIGGCLFYDGQLLCSQLPPDFGDKLMLVANGGVELNSKSILGDLQTPDKVWVVDIFLTPEELAIIHHIQQPRKDMTSVYSTLTPNSDLTSAVLSQSSQNHLDDLSRRKLASSKEELSFSSSSDYTTIYGSESSKGQSVISPLKRPRKNRRISEGKEDLPEYDALFPSPENEEVPPPLPPKPGPPPVPKRNAPKPPPRSTSANRPQLPLKKEEPSPTQLWIYGDVLEVPSSPPATYSTPTSSLPPGDISRRDSDNSDRFGTPPSTSPLPDAIDQSVAFGTPLLTSPSLDRPNLNIGNLKDLTSCDLYDQGDTPGGVDIYHDSLSSPVDALTLTLKEVDPSSQEVDPSSQEVVDPSSKEVNPSSKEVDPSSKEVDPSSQQVDPSSQEVDPSSQEVDPSSQEVVDPSSKEVDPSSKEDDVFRKTSRQSQLSGVSSNSSLVITKAVSEPPGSYTGSFPRNLEALNLSDEEEDIENEPLPTDTTPLPPPSKFYTSERKPVTDAMDPVSFGATEEIDFSEEEEEEEVTRSLQTRSPVLEGNESTSESEDTVSSLDANKSHFPTKRPRAETWAGIENLDEGEYSMRRRAAPLERKTLYIQKCMKTVVAILCNTGLPEDHKGIQSLWTLMLTQLLHINNKVETCLLEKEALYAHVPGENTKTDVRCYQAMYSGLTGNCEVSSITAPYQFRHAARRAHQEFTLNPSLMQISLCKDYCRMFCQNVMGRESYLHNNRVIMADSLSIHTALEKQAKSLRKQNGQTNIDGVDDMPNVSFL